MKNANTEIEHKNNKIILRKSQSSLLFFIKYQFLLLIKKIN